MSSEIKKLERALGGPKQLRVMAYLFNHAGEREMFDADDGSFKQINIKAIAAKSKLKKRQVRLALKDVWAAFEAQKSGRLQ